LDISKTNEMDTEALEVPVSVSSSFGKLKAFTMLELLISMTLTSILVAFSYMGYNQMQKLFLMYAKQHEFITEYNQLNSILKLQAEKADVIEKIDEQHILFKKDSTTMRLEILPKSMVISYKQRTDTFHLEAKKINFEFQQANERLITSLSSDVFFENQKFRVSFSKQYDAESILNKVLEKEKK
jgi:prepilin-type N-terminal cleavage/methylation domain-containing protein